MVLNNESNYGIAYKRMQLSQCVMHEHQVTNHMCLKPIFGSGKNWKYQVPAIIFDVAIVV